MGNITRAHRSARAEAVEKGLPTFLSDKPCRAGHTSPRSTAHGKCIECHTARGAAWVVANREQRRQWENEHKRKKREAMWAAEGVEYRAPGHKRAPLLSAEEKLARSRACSLRYYRDNPEKAAVIARQYYEEHKDHFRARLRNRRAKKGGNDGQNTAADIASLLQLQKGKCTFCLRPLGKSFHIDHHVPLSRGGTNDWRNLRLLHKVCNLRKHAKHPSKFALENGLLCF